MTSLVPKKRTFLNMKKKVELIHFTEKNPGISIRNLEQIFTCCRTQIASILKNKESILTMYESNVSGDRLHVNVLGRKSQFSEINKVLYEWYSLACSKNIYPGGPQLMEKAKEISERIKISNFKCSRGWLQKWKLRYNVKQLTICGESGDVQGPTVSSWKERLPEILQGYTKEDIWNMDVTGVFGRL